MTHHRKTRPDPNVSDPLSEPSLNRRVWAAYLHRGYSRSTFAKALGMTYVAINDWDIGKTVPSLQRLLQAAELLDFTMDELCYGRSSPRLRRLEPELTRDAAKLLLVELRAAHDEIEALGEHERSAAGQFQRFTRTYVAAFVQAHAAARAAGEERLLALQSAKEAAANARANADAIALHYKSISAEQLADAGLVAAAKSAKKIPAPTLQAVQSGAGRKATGPRKTVA